MKPWAKSFYKSKAWRQCRDAYFISKQGLCETCGEAGKIVHHTVYLTPDNINNPEVSLNWDLLRLDCQTCHNQEHQSSEVTAEGLRFDSNGDIISTKVERQP